MQSFSNLFLQDTVLHVCPLFFDLFITWKSTVKQHWYFCGFHHLIAFTVIYSTFHICTSLLYFLLFHYFPVSSLVLYTFFLLYRLVYYIHMCGHTHKISVWVLRSGVRTVDISFSYQCDFNFCKSCFTVHSFNKYRIITQCVLFQYFLSCLVAMLNTDFMIPYKFSNL